MRGSVRVARFMLGLARRFGAEAGTTIVAAEVNGQPGAITYLADGSVGNVFTLDVVDGRISAVRSVANFEKLRHVPPMTSG